MTVAVEQEKEMADYGPEESKINLLENKWSFQYINRFKLYQRVIFSCSRNCLTNQIQNV